MMAWLTQVFRQIKMYLQQGMLWVLVLPSPLESFREWVFNKQVDCLTRMWTSSEVALKTLHEAGVHPKARLYMGSETPKLPMGPKTQTPRVVELSKNPQPAFKKGFPLVSIQEDPLETTP